jgi:hypothetical protein
MGEDVLGDPFMMHPQKITKPKRRTGSHIGCPAPWFAWVFPLMNGKNQLGLVLYLYRRCCICHSDTITVPNSEVAELLGLRAYLG